MRTSIATTSNHFAGAAPLAPPWNAAECPIAPAAPAVVDDVPAVSMLIGDVYDAALDPTLWTAVLPRIRQYISGAAAALLSKDIGVGSLDVHYHCGGIDSHYRQLYLDTYADLDPLTAGHVLAELEQPICAGDIMPYDAFFATRFYKEWAQPQGIVDVVSAVLERSATGAAMLGVFRHEQDGLVDDATRWRMRQIVPHIRRAAAIGRVIDCKTTEAARFGYALDALNAGIFFVDANGRIVHANASGHAMLADGSVLRAAGSKLVATGPGAAAALDEILAAGEGGPADANKSLAVPLPGRDDGCYIAHLLPRASGARQYAAQHLSGIATVLVRKAEIAGQSLPQILTRHYGLTPTELRVLFAIVHVGGVPETSRALGIGESTVKTHLHRMFSKTGTARQADLVRLVANFSNPLVG